jgi:hypothetical protein
MAQTEGDFGKGEADGVKATLAVVAATWHSGERVTAREQADGQASKEVDVERN